LEEPLFSDLGVEVEGVRTRGSTVDDEFELLSPLEMVKNNGNKRKAGRIIVRVTTRDHGFVEKDVKARIW
jgi:hypothetical protein